MRISRAKASARSKKGWETRRKKYTQQAKSRVKKEINPKTHAKRAARKYAKNRLGDWIDNNHYQYHWQRPNGQNVRITGFNTREAHEVSKVLTQLDRRVKPNVKFDVSIEKRHAPLQVQIPMRFRAGGVHIPSFEDLQYTHNKTAKPKDRISDKQMKFAKPIWYSQGIRGHARIYIQPEHLKSGGGYTSLVHELGHSADTGRYKHSGSKEYRQASKWKDSAKFATGFDKSNAKHRQPGYKGGWYQSVSPEEDFAETFTRAMVGPTYSHQRGVVYDKNRRAYMEANVLNRKANKNLTTKVKRKWVAL